MPNPTMPVTRVPAIIRTTVMAVYEDEFFGTLVEYGEHDEAHYRALWDEGQTLGSIVLGFAQKDNAVRLPWRPDVVVHI